MKNLLAKARVKSPWVLHYDAGACNGCDIEILACLTPVYDIERFGIVNIGNPKHADVMVVTGTVNPRNARVLRNLYDQMPDPKVVVAVGACACSGGIFRECYNVMNGVSSVLPVDVYVPGCAPKPEAIIEGIVMGLGEMGKPRREAAVPAETVACPAAAAPCARDARPMGSGRADAEKKPEEELATA